MTEKEVDILIIGGGLTGAILMLALANKGYRLALVDTHPLNNKISPDFDARSLALAPASQRILKTLGIWSFLQKQATPIEGVHVSDQSRFGAARLQGKPEDPLGYVVEIQQLYAALYPLLHQEHILAPAQVTALDKKNTRAIIRTTSSDCAIGAKLIIAADGVDSTIRRLSGLGVQVKDYAQKAIVANIGLARSHGYQAYERFTSAGPLALLPLKNNCSALVWALEANDAMRLMEADEKKFLATLQRTFGYRLGRFVQLGRRVVFPLRQVIMMQQTLKSIVFVGNAAHTLHPVAAQGFNLGLRDVATLAQCILQDGLNEKMLNRYQGMRRHDQTAIVSLTNHLINMFTSHLPGVAFARNLGLIAVDNLPFLKRGLTDYLRGYGGVTADLVCGIALASEAKQS